MATINELIEQIENPELRKRIADEVAKLNKQKKFGLVFEEHLPECTPLYDIPVKKGALVMVRGGDIKELYYVRSIADGQAECVKKDSGETKMVAVDSLVTVAQFGEPIYPYLKPIDSICNAPDSDLWHTLIEADNYHALQLLEYLYAGKVDCIYIDPPYNTGAKDWKYNNDYVDGNDQYRHSKWLSMMQKRLKIAKKLLNPADSVLIVTIDEKEYLHLGCLLEEMFPEAFVQMVSSVISSHGSARDGHFSRADEFIFYVFIGSAKVCKSEDDMLNEGLSETKSQLWFQFIRCGKNGYRNRAKSLFYPIFIDSNKGSIVSIGESVDINTDKQTVSVPNGQVALWPIDAHGNEMTWATSPEVAQRRLSKGLLRLGKTSKNDIGWSLMTVREGTEKRIETGEVIIEGLDERGGAILVDSKNSSLREPKTVWNKAAHNAGWYGSKVISQIIPGRVFAYPKSIYSTHDAIRFFVANKPNALIVDFFAGSGTTMHAVNLLNAEDGGHRRCILVTNNEVSEVEKKDFEARGIRPGDEEWEAKGIAHYVTWPRTVCSIKGENIKGEPLKGNYIGSDIPMSDGFKANANFFKLGFLDKTRVSLGMQFAEMLPTLWMKAGAYGKCPSIDGKTIPQMLILPQNRMAVLNDENCFAQFAEELEKHPEIESVFLVTDYEASFVSMTNDLIGKTTYQLYRDYLDNFRINAGRNAR